MNPSQLATLSILSVPVHDVTYAETLDLLGEWIASGKPHQICTVNPEFVMKARENPAFGAVLRRADLCLPDGVGLLWAAKVKGHHLRERVAGSTLMYPLAERAAQAGWRVFYLGAAPGIAAKTAAILQARYPNLQVAGTYSGDDSPAESEKIIQMVRESRADVLLVAFGNPKQDFWIAHHAHQLAVPVMIGVGGSFDFVAGVAKRAPLGWQKLGLEWLHRLLNEPKRWRRMLALPRFAWAVALGRNSVVEWKDEVKELRS
jgi:N-acetylglucosaminyldiphosphoundecaprenol N-acetyl-beta-D-mannosaminyltransferase